MNTRIGIGTLRDELTRFVSEYAGRYNERDWWRPPLLASGRVDERFEILPKIAADDHFLPNELLQSVRTAVVFFIPFKVELAEENHPGKFPCPNWGIAYEVTNELIERACERLQTVLVENGHQVVTMPATTNYEEDADRLTARWSHKHLGYVCGLGRFGVNAQFITPSGCAGRMGSLITSADLGDHPLVTKAELCLHKVGRECLQCVARCPVKAVSLDGIDRRRCNNRLHFNWKNRIKLGLGERSHGCAKCQVNVPCSLADPTAELGPVTLQDVREASERIRPYIRRTPLLRQKNMDEVLGCQTYLKPEMLQVTGAFKLRGALSKILSLTPDELKKGIITSSSGNHGQACAYVGQMLGIRTTVVIPEDAPTVKIENARAMGAEVIVWRRSYDERWKKIREEVAEHGYTIVHAFEDYTVMAGQGTIGLEIIEDLPTIDTVLVPIGGGGLISGISTAIKESKPNVRVIGVQAAASPAYYVSRQNGYPSEVPSLPTVADGLSCRRPGKNPYPIIEKYVDEIVVVEEEEILEAVRFVARHAKLVAEPSACVGVAALLSGKVKTRPDEKVCLVLTSGNWDIDSIGKILKGEQVEGVLR